MNIHMLYIFYSFVALKLVLKVIKYTRTYLAGKFSLGFLNNQSTHTDQ